MQSHQALRVPSPIVQMVGTHIAKHQFRGYVSADQTSAQCGCETDHRHLRSTLPQEAKEERVALEIASMETEFGQVFLPIQCLLCEIDNPLSEGCARRWMFTRNEGLSVSRTLHLDLSFLASSAWLSSTRSRKLCVWKSLASVTTEVPLGSLRRTGWTNTLDAASQVQRH